MAQAEQAIDLLAIQADAQQAYDNWAPNHADGLYVTVRPFNPEEEYQRIDKVRIEPNPNLELARVLGESGMGKKAYDRLSAGYQEFLFIERAMGRARKHKSSVVTTLHLLNTLDTAETHDNLFVTSGGDPEVAKVNDIIVNPMMCRLNLGGQAVYGVLSASGYVDLMLPYRAALVYGMNKETGRYLATRMKAGLDERLDEGVIVHWSLPGTRSRPAVLKDGQPARVVQRVNDAVAGMVIERTPFMQPVPMILSQPGDAAVEVLRPRTVRSIKGVHTVMREMVEVANTLSDEEIHYGLPKGAQYLAA